MKTRKFKCAHCGGAAAQLTSAVNRARKLGANLYCDRVCAGLARRMNRTTDEKKARKAAYDAEYREKNRALLKTKKAAWYQANHDPILEKAKRRANAHLHAEYIKTPRYRAWKADYDRRYRAAEFGEYADAYLLTLEVNKEVAARMSREDISSKNGTLNKKQRRRRKYEAQQHW